PATGSVLSSPSNRPDTSTSGLALQLVQDAERIAGAGSAMLPGWRQLPGWTSDRWQRVGSALRSAGLVDTDPGKGTYLVKYNCLADLESALRSRQIKIRPSPYPAAGD